MGWLADGCRPLRALRVFAGRGELWPLSSSTADVVVRLRGAGRHNDQRAAGPGSTVSPPAISPTERAKNSRQSLTLHSYLTSMYSVRGHIMIPYRFRGEVFGPAQRLHGAMYVMSSACRGSTPMAS
jgi:hypothetical protein